MPLRLTVDGAGVATTVEPTESLLESLRRLGHTSPKGACLEGECGSCSVVLDGSVVCSCLVLSAVCDGRDVVTAAGVDAPDLAEALVEHGAVQCGFCTPGIVVAASVFLDRASGPVDREAIVEALSGNLCRCTGYLGIVAAVEQTLARRLAERAR